MELTNAQFDIFRQEITQALQSVAQKYGCTVTAGNIKYDETVTNINLSFKSIAVGGMDTEQYNFYKYCEDFGFCKEDYLTVMTNPKGEKLVFCGFLPSGRKYKCELRDSTGKHYKSTVDAVRAGIRSNKIL